MAAPLAVTAAGLAVMAAPLAMFWFA